MVETGSREQLTFEVKGLDCPDCALSFEKAVQQLPGIASAHLVYPTSKLFVSGDHQQLSIAALHKLAGTMGYEVVHDGEPAAEAKGLVAWLRAREKVLSPVVGGVLLLAGALLSLLGAPPLTTQLVLGASIVLAGYPMARAGWIGAVKGHTLDINALMTIAAIGAMAVGQFTEGAVTVFLFSVGEAMERYSADRARGAIRALMNLAPQKATVLSPTGEHSVAVQEIHVGDRIVVRPGDRLPMDGRVIEGRSAIDQAPVTGESLPVDVSPGDEVFAGTLNGRGALVVEVTRRAEDNTIARIIRMVEDAQTRRAPVERFVDRFAKIYTPIVIGLAVLIASVPPLLGLGAFSVWFYRALVLLVIACPCALVISTPVTIVSALARAARAGVLIKGGRYLEQMATLRAIAFDKTGTLTVGRPVVVGGGCELGDDLRGECDDCRELVAKAAAVEARSEHALAQAITQYADQLGVSRRYEPATMVGALPGLGVQGQVDGHQVSVGSVAYCEATVGAEDPLCTAAREAEGGGHTVLVIQDACCDVRCFLVVSDALRPETAPALRALREAGVAHTAMLTGDNASVARTIADQAGIEDVRAGLLPGDKVYAVDELQALHDGKVGMVGDGVNDAPALARATVGIAMGAAGSDVALETADVALMTSDLNRVPFVIALSRKALRIIRANITLALVTKAAFVILAALGLASLWMAVLADVGVSLIVSANGMRMLRFRAKEHTI